MLTIEDNAEVRELINAANLNMRMASALYVQYVKSTRGAGFPRCRGRSLGRADGARSKEGTPVFLVGGKPEVLAQTELNCTTSGM